MTLVRYVVLALTVVLGASPAAWAQSDLVPVDWNRSFFLQGQGGIENPIVRVGFNPQPEPPAAFALLATEPSTRLDLSDPMNPLFTRPSPSGPSADSFFDLFFAVGGLRTPLITVPEAASGGPGFSSVAFDVFMGVDPVLSVFFDVFTSTPGSQGMDWVSLNPQPEVPSNNLFGPESYGGFNFNFTSFSELYVGMRIYDVQGNQLSMAAIPEPETYALMLAGLGLLGFIARRRKQKQAA